MSFGRKYWVSLLVLALGVAFLMVLASNRSVYKQLLVEDGPVEYATSMALAFGAALFALAASRARPGADAFYFLGTMSALLFVGAMDEISWGQRLFEVGNEEIGECLLSVCLCAFAAHEAARAGSRQSALPPVHSAPAG